jgi:hypothetical protein
MRKVSPRIPVFFILLFGITISLSAAAKSVSRSITSDKCGTPCHQRKDLDTLATDLSKLTDVYRVQESIVIPLPDRKFFDHAADALTYKGKQFISKTADFLSDYPDTYVYIQENATTKAPSEYRAIDQGFLVQTALKKDGVDINRLEVDLSTPPAPQQPEKIGNKRLSPEQFFELRIVPRV